MSSPGSVDGDERGSAITSGGGLNEDNSALLDGKHRRTMTAEEKTVYERERNRLHARNTRARKRQYVEELKERVENLQEQKLKAECLRVEKRQRAADKKKCWEDMLRRVLQLRCKGVVDENAWREVLSETFRLTLPLTPYRSSNPCDTVEHRRVLIGVDGMISDTMSLTKMCMDLAERCSKSKGDAPGTKGISEGEGRGESATGPGRGAGGGGGAGTGEGSGAGAGDDGCKRVHIEYLTGTDDFLFSGDEGIMCTFIMRTTDAKLHGALIEVEKKGMLRTGFSADGKLNELDMLFDGMMFYRQLQKTVRANSEGWPAVKGTHCSSSDSSHPVGLPAPSKPDVDAQPSTSCPSPLTATDPKTAVMLKIVPSPPDPPSSGEEEEKE